MNSRLKILMLTEFFKPFDRGGSEWSVYYLAKAIIKKHHQVAIFTPNYGTKPYDVVDKIEIYRFPFIKHINSQSQLIPPFYYTNLIWFFSTLIYLLYRTNKYHPTHLHVQGKYFLPAAVIVGKLLHVPVLTTIRDYILLCPYAYCINEKNNFQSCSLIHLLQKDLKIFLKNSDKTLTIIDIFYSYLATLHGWLISRTLKFFLIHCQKIVGISKKLTYIYNLNSISINKTIYNTAVFNNFTVSNSKIENIILFIGRLTRGKGIDKLVKAYSYLKIDGKPKLVVIGEGPLYKKVKSYEQKNLIILGHLPYKKVLSFIRKARLIVVPSYWEEPFGRTALESLSLGVPVLGTNRGGLPEIIQSGITGVIVESSVSGILFGLKSSLKIEKNLRNNIKKQFPKLKNKFEITPVNQYINLYQNLH